MSSCALHVDESRLGYVFISMPKWPSEGLTDATSNEGAEVWHRATQATNAANATLITVKTLPDALSCSGSRKFHHSTPLKAHPEHRTAARLAAHFDHGIVGGRNT